jgi:hypothetical protein
MDGDAEVVEDGKVLPYLQRVFHSLPGATLEVITRGDLARLWATYGPDEPGATIFEEQFTAIIRNLFMMHHFAAAFFVSLLTIDAMLREASSKASEAQTERLFGIVEDLAALVVAYGKRSVPYYS